MEFKTLFSILKNRMGDGDDVPYFFREIMAMITTVSEEEWGTSKDPAAKKLSDETIRSYTKRKLPKKLCQSIVYRLTPEVLEKKIKERPESTCKLLAEDLQIYDTDIDKNNVGQKVADIMVEMIQVGAGLVPLDDLKKQQQEQMALELKNQYGDYLLQESEGYCPFPGCGKQLYVINGTRTVPFYQVSLIDKSKGKDIDNLIALCPQCYATYLIDSSKKLYKELKAVKNVLAIHKQGVQLLDNMQLEKGIIGVISKIKELKQEDLVDASMDPKEIKQKVDPNTDSALNGVVNYYVSTYFYRVKEIMENLDKRKIIDYEEIQDQMKAFYRKLKKNKKSQIEIFSAIVEKGHHVSLQEAVYCQIVVAYFIQSCEVFDAITK